MSTHTCRFTYFCHPPVFGTTTVPVRLVVKSSHPLPPETRRKEPLDEPDDTTKSK